MAENKIIGYKNIFGFVLPDWVDEATIRLLVTFLLSSATMLFVLIFFIWPRFEDLAKKRTELERGIEKLASLKNSKQGFDKLSEQIPEETQTLVLSAIPQSYSPENAVFLLRKIASETSGVSIVSYKLPSGVLFEGNDKKATEKEETDMVTFLNYPIRLVVTAPVNSLLDFIKKVETSLPFGMVSDVGMQEITKLAKSTTTKSIQMEIEVMYYQALVNTVDISKIDQISPQDLTLVKALSGYTKVGTFGGSDVSPVSDPNGLSGSLFGF